MAFRDDFGVSIESTSIRFQIRVELMVLKLLSSANGFFIGKLKRYQKHVKGLSSRRAAHPASPCEPSRMWWINFVMYSLRWDLKRIWRISVV
jgi:hypothetical protein